MSLKCFLQGVFCLLILVLGANSNVQAQDSFIQFYEEKAKEKMAVGNYAAALQDYFQILDKKGNSTDALYDVANCYYRMEEYDKAIEYARRITARDRNYIKAYRLIGNSFDLSGRYAESVNFFQDAIVKLPYEGELYLDLGIVEFLRENLETALNYWEQGIRADPYYADNYYWAAKQYANSNKKIWAIIYAEYFLNIEKNTERTVEISKLLLTSYYDYVRERNGEILNYDNYFDDGENYNIFEEAFDNTHDILMDNGILNLNILVKYMQGNKPTYLRGINNIRDAFVDVWSQTQAQSFKMPLYDWSADMKRSGYYDAYSHWVMMSAEPNYFIEWKQKSFQSYQNFIKWYGRNPLKINVVSYFCRLDHIRRKPTPPPPPPPVIRVDTLNQIAPDSIPIRILGN